MKAGINYWIVGIAALVYYIGGLLWYSPLLFGKIRTRLTTNSNEQKKEKGKHLWIIYMAGFISAFIISYTLAVIIHHLQANTYIKGVKTGLICWLGFVITSNIMNTLLAKGSFKLLFIHMGYQLYGLLVMGVILAI